MIFSITETQHESDAKLISNSLNSACDHCRSRKIKCNSAKPSCLYCSNRSLNCTYSINKKKQIFTGTPLQISLTELEDRVKRLESLSSDILKKQQQITQPNPYPAPFPISPAQPNWIPAQLSAPSFDHNNLNILSSQLDHSNDTSSSGPCLEVGGHNNFNLAFTFSQDSVTIHDLRRILLASYRSKDEFKGFANHHKSLLIELCLSSDLVMAAFCAVSCAHASFPFLDRTPVTRRRLIDHFLSYAKSLLVQYGYVNPSLAVIQAILLIGIVEYERGCFDRSIMYHQSMFSMACILGLPQLDSHRLGTITSEDAPQRKIWWEIFTMDRCLPVMIYTGKTVIRTEYEVMLADSNGHSLGLTLDELQVSHVLCYKCDPDPVWRLLPVVRLKMLDFLWRAHKIAAQVSESQTMTLIEETELLQLRQDLADWSIFASPNPFLGRPLPPGHGGGTGLPTSPADHPATQASFILLFNCAYILAYCPTLYSSSGHIHDSCGVAAGHLLDSISLSKPEDPRGERWHQVLPFFAYIGCLTYYRLCTSQPLHPLAHQTALDRFRSLYLELALSLPRFPVADLFMAKLRPLRDAMDDSPL